MRYIFLLILMILPISSIAAQGYVVYTKWGCDYYIVSTNKGLAVLEWYGGNTPDKGDFIIGDFESYGMKSLINRTYNRETKAWVEDYWLSSERAVEILANKCL